MLGWNIIDSLEVSTVVFVPVTSLLSDSWSDDGIFSTIIDIDFLSLDIGEIINFSRESLGLSVEGIKID